MRRITAGCSSLRAVITASSVPARGGDVLRKYGWSPVAAFPRQPQMSLALPRSLGLTTAIYRDIIFPAYGGTFPDGVRVENGCTSHASLPGIGFEGRAT